MSALPVYEVEFIPLERRLGDRRIAPRGAALPRARASRHGRRSAPERDTGGWFPSRPSIF